ncbi:hypothetical protein [Paramesorhizobium deserti]|uniref:hypothetical protein n=1 Tax=Paramesorhizobium deserti TaxID=1494590 RepID=UPI00137A87A7|nr:hypothetical protein [Paramesorhizobium deserti]
MSARTALILVLAAVASSCAGPGRELKAPCGALTSYADGECGPAKPVNTIFGMVDTDHV